MSGSTPTIATPKKAYVRLIQDISLAYGVYLLGTLPQWDLPFLLPIQVMTMVGALSFAAFKAPHPRWLYVLFVAQTTWLLSVSDVLFRDASIVSWALALFRFCLLGIVATVLSYFLTGFTEEPQPEGQVGQAHE